MKTIIRRTVGVVSSISITSDFHVSSETAMTNTSEKRCGDDERQRLRERAMAGFDDLEPKLRGMIEKRIPTRLKSKVDVEGVFQAARIGLLDSLESKQPKSDAELLSWIFKRTWSRWQDEMRKWRTDARQVERENPLPSGSDIAFVEGIGVATNFGLKETVERIREVLKPIDFQIVELTIVDELSYSEIAAFLNLTPESVRKRYVRALLKIRQVITSPFSSSS